MDRQDPLPRWAWPAIAVALVGFALFAWSLRLQQGRSLEVHDPDGLVGPAELVESRAIPAAVWDLRTGPFELDGRVAVPFGANPCPTVRVEVEPVGEGGARLAMRVLNGDCDDVGVAWLLLITSEDASLLGRSLEVVPLDETPPRRASSEIPFGTWPPPSPAPSPSPD